MMGRTHQVINAAAVSAVAAAVPVAGGRTQPLVVVAATAMAWATARWPDVTNARSRPGRQLARCAPVLAVAIQGHGSGHRRGWSHSVFTGMTVAGVGGGLAVQVAGPWWWIGAVPGLSWTLHVLSDCLTWDGVAALLPVSRRVVRPRYGLRIECGGRAERFVVLPAVLVLWVLAIVVMAVAA